MAHWKPLRSCLTPAAFYSASQYNDTDSEVFVDARSEFGASLRSELDLPTVSAGLHSENILSSPATGPPSAAGTADEMAAPVRAPPEASPEGVLPAAAAAAVPVVLATSKEAAPQGVPAGAGDTLLMTPRTRARMDPMGDIVRMIETGSARKGARPPNLPSGARATPVAAAVSTETPGSAEGTNLGAAFDMEADSKLPAAEALQTSLRAEPVNADAGSTGAGLLPPPAAGTTTHAAEPPSSAQADPMAVVTEPAGVEFLPPAVAGVTEDVVEPLSLAHQPAQAVDASDAVISTRQALQAEPSQSPAMSAATAAESAVTGGLVADSAIGAGAAASLQPEFVDPVPAHHPPPAAVRLPLMGRFGSAPSLPGTSPTPAALAESSLAEPSKAAEPAAVSAGPRREEAALPVPPTDQQGAASAPSGPEMPLEPSTAAARPRVSFAPLPAALTAAGAALGAQGEGTAAEQPRPSADDAMEAKDDLAAADLPPGPPPIAVPPPQEAVPVASPASVFSPTDSQPESLAQGADLADAELLTLQRAKTKEGDAAGTATEMPLGTLPAVVTASRTVGAPAEDAASDADSAPSKTATARAALLGTGLTDDALPGAVTVGGVAAAIGAAAAAVGGKMAETHSEAGGYEVWARRLVFHANPVPK